MKLVNKDDDVLEFYLCYDPCCAFMAWQIIACRSLLEVFFSPQPHGHQTHIYTNTHMPSKALARKHNPSVS